MNSVICKRLIIMMSGCMLRLGWIDLGWMVLSGHLLAAGSHGGVLNMNAFLMLCAYVRLAQVRSCASSEFRAERRVSDDPLKKIPAIR